MVQHADDSVRDEVAREAARLMAESGRRDFAGAKRKAASRLRAFQPGELPSNVEVAEALVEHQRVFNDAYEEQCRAMLEAALQAFTLFSKFQPRIAGEVLEGTVDENSVLTVHLFAESSEEVGEYLRANRYRYRNRERLARYSKERVERTPSYETEITDVPVELVVFSPLRAREAPKSAVHGRPIQRVGRKEIRALLAGLAS